MTTAILSHIKLRKSSLKSISLLDFPNVNWKFVCCVSIIIFAALLTFYVSQVNFLTSGYYMSGNYESQISKLLVENKNLQVSIAENSFLEQIVQKTHDMGFEKVASVQYVHVLDGSVAAAK